MFSKNPTLFAQLIAILKSFQCSAISLAARLLVLIAAFLAAESTGVAATLDWNSVDWTQRWRTGSTNTNPVTQTFSNVDGSGVNMTFTIQRGTNTGTGEVSSPTETPDDTSDPIAHNYENPVQRSLMVDVNFDDRSNDYIEFTISFSKPVSALSFELRDIDLANTGTSRYQDVVTNFTATGSVTPTFTLLGSNNADGDTSVDAEVVGALVRGIRCAGSTTGVGNENDDLNSGDVRVNYGSNAISQITFRYQSGGGPSGTFSSDPTLQRIALGDFTFTPPPTLVSMNDNDADNEVTVNTALTYTVTFSQDINAATVTAADFVNAGTAAITIGTITETSAGVFSVQVTPTSTGNIMLRIPVGAVISSATGGAVDTTAALSGGVDTVTVISTNNAPVATANSYSVNEDATLAVVSPGVLANDTDADSNPLTAVLVSGVSNGTLSLSANGSFTYTPTGNFSGTDSFTYRANDGTANSNTATVTITVTAVNDAPVAVANSYTVAEDATLTVPAATGVLVNDSDVEGSTLSAVLVSGVSNGTLSLSANGSFTYTPTGNFSGTDSFTYKANDGTADSNTVTVTITVTAVNDAPVAVANSYTVAEDATLTVPAATGVLVNDTDADGNPLTAALVSGVSNGTLSLSANGSFTYTPTGNFSGTDSFTYRANDGTANSNVTTVTITVTAVNDAPVAVANSYTVAEDATLAVPALTGVLANDTDADGNPLTAVLVSGVSNGTLSLSADGSFTYTPTGNFSGTDSFTYRANDGTANSNTVTVTITVTAVNDAPVAVANSYTVAEDATLTVPVATGVLVNDTDAEGNPLTAALVSGVSNGTLSLSANGSFTYTPTGNFSGTDSFTYKANDGTADSNTVTVTITVTAVNDAPVAVANSYSVAEDAALTVPLLTGVLSNDTDLDGNPLTAVLVTGVSNGTLTLNANGTFTYTPTGNFSGTDSFTYKANDGTADSNTVTVTITVTAVNDAPVAVANSYSVAEDTALTVPVLTGVLSNDTDLDGNPLTAVLVTGVSNGTLTLNANGTFTYTPTGNFSGTDSFTYKANDGTADSNTVTVTLNVTAVDDAPVAVVDSYTVVEDGTLTVPVATGVRANDIDADGNPLTVVLVGNVSNGTLTLNPDGSFTYTPNANFSGTDSFTYKVNDGTTDSNTVTVTFTVTAVNDAPVATVNSYTTGEDIVLNVAAPGVLGNDTDGDGNPLTAILVGNASNGTLTLNADGSFNYTPNANFSGTDSFTYKANDGTADSNTVAVTINVTAVNDAPVAVANSYTVAEDNTLTVPLALGVLLNDMDVDGDGLTAILVSGVSNGTLTLNSDGTFTYTPTGNFSGTDSFTYKANDGLVDSNTVTVTINVSAVNDAPLAVANSYTVAEDTTLTVPLASGVLLNDTDTEGNSLTAILVGNVSNGTLALNADGTFTYTPSANFNGTDSFTYRANDGTADSNIVAVTITVTAVNDVPVAVANSYTIAEDGTLTVPLATGVLVNDIDVEGNTLTAILVGDVSNGTLTLNADGTFTYTPNANFSGTDSFTYKANDGTGDSNTVTVTINVAAVNDAPVAVANSFTITEDGTLSVPFATGVLVNDTDVEGDGLTAVLVSGVSNGTLTLNSDGTFTYAPTANFNGTDSFTYKANDGTADSNTVAVTITVTAANDAPVAVANSYTVAEEGTLTVPAAGVLINDIDVDGDGLTAILVTGVSNGTLSLNADGSFTYTPNANYNGTDSFTYKANDGTVDSNTVAVTLNVTAMNDAPVAVANSYTIAEDGTLTVPAASGVLVNDTDPEGDSLTAALVTGVSNGTLTLNPDGSFTYTPTANFNGTDSFTYRANDGTSNSNIVTVTLNVTSVNDAPVVSGGSYTVAEDTTLTVVAPGVLTGSSDVESSALTASVVSNVGNGTLTLNGDGSFTYTPSSNYTGPDSFTFKANDGTADSNVATITISVTPVNDAPVAVANTYTLAEDGSITVPAPGVIANDTDAEDEPLTAALVGNVSSGTLAFNADGSFTYTPSANFNGADSFTYRVNDGTSDSNIVTVTLNVTASNDAPVAVANSYTVVGGGTLLTPAPGILANDTDVEGSPLTAILVTGVSNGTLTLNPDGSFVYAPNAAFSGTDTFTYRANDGTADSAPVAVTITVTVANTAPTAVVDFYTATSGTTLTVPASGVLSNDTDPENNPLSAVLVSGVSNGTVSLNSNGSFTYTPQSSFVGTDTFIYRASDGTLTSNITTVSITVSAPPVPNRPPVLTNPGTHTTTVMTPITIAVSTSDPDGDPVTLTVGTPNFGTVTGTGPQFTYTPPAEFAGVAIFTITASDGRGGSVTRTARINVVAEAAIVGNYSILLYDDQGEVAGHIKFVASRLNRAMGVYSMNGIHYNARAFIGGAAHDITPRVRGAAPVLLGVTTDHPAPGRAELVVSVTEGEKTYVGRAARSPYSRTNRAPQTGRYTIINSRQPLVLDRTGFDLPDAERNAPLVASALTVQVTTTGSVQFRGSAGHGFPVVCSSYVMEGSKVPYYADRRAPGASVQHADFNFPADPANTTATPGKPAVWGSLRWLTGVDRRIATPIDATYAVLGARFTPQLNPLGLLNSNTLQLTLNFPSNIVGGVVAPYTETRSFEGVQLPRLSGNITAIRPSLSTGSFNARWDAKVDRPIFGVIIQGEGIDLGMGAICDWTDLGTCELRAVR